MISRATQMKIIENLSKEVEVINKEPGRNHRTKK